MKNRKKAAILKILSKKSYLYCFIGLQMTKVKITWHNFKKKWAFLAYFLSIFPLNKEEKWLKNRKSNHFENLFERKTTFNCFTLTNAPLSDKGVPFMVIWVFSSFIYMTNLKSQNVAWEKKDYFFLLPTFVAKKQPWDFN